MPTRRGRREFVGGTGREIKEARVDVILQRVEEKIGSEINAYPSHVYRYGVNNIFQRSFAYLIGWKSNGEPHKVAVTSGGLLKVAISGAGFEEIDTLEGTATVNWSSALEFAWTPNRIRFEALDYPYLAKFSTDGVRWSDEVYIDGDQPRDFNINAKYVKVRRYGGTNAKYFIIGMR
ncbi:MAG: hypothetical protein OBKJMPBA_00004 [Methanophagales virus PBV304]|uniref:Uncharacterized protein n=1 Tax=Methanophagales virus PBV304 TaxID=3071309 RepID=A0AA46YJ93_9VIRU|nr:MAG: hypothetical protein QIT47_gp04 [Methanophagales virus PBV304]UYL65036.1 MAG: hypothetical protein OBKJMPBA_00004 [Methanophagales virus PBV304]